MTYPEALIELIDDFQSIDDKMERLEYVFDLASEVNELPVAQCSEETRIHCCQAEAHVLLEIID